MFDKLYTKFLFFPEFDVSINTASDDEICPEKIKKSPAFQLKKKHKSNSFDTILCGD